MGRSWSNCWKCGGRSESEVCVSCGTFAEDDPLVGVIMGGCELVSLLSNDVDSLLYKARASGRDRVAVRLLPRDLWGDSTAIARFSEARRRHEFVKHPGVSPVIDGGTSDDGAAFYVVEWVGGDALSEHLSSKPTPPSIVRAIDMGLQMAAAVAAIHDVGVFHNRISPHVFRNLAGFDGTTDWMRLPHTGSSGSVRGSGGELVKCPSWRGDRVWKTYHRHTEDFGGVSNDVFGLVASFYHVLTGGRPFIAGRSGSARLVLAQQWRPELVHNPKLVTLLERGLSTKARERFDTASEFHRALELTREEAEVAEHRLSGTRRARSGTEPRISAIKRPATRRQPIAPTSSGKKRTGTGALPIVERRPTEKPQTGRMQVIERKTGEQPKNLEPAAPELSADEVADQILAALGSRPTDRRQATPVARPAPISAPVHPEPPAKSERVDPPRHRDTPPDDDDDVFGKVDSAQGHAVTMTGVGARLLAFSDALHEALMRDIAEHGRFEMSDISAPEEPPPPDSDALFGV